MHIGSPGLAGLQRSAPVSAQLRQNPHERAQRGPIHAHSRFTGKNGLRADGAGASSYQNKALLKALARLLREQTRRCRRTTRATWSAPAPPVWPSPGGPAQAHPQVLETCALGCEQLAAMPDIIGEITALRQQPSGIRVGQMRVPIGVFGMIFESRPMSPSRPRPVDQERQRLHSARRLRGHRLQQGAGPKLVQQALEDADLPQDAVQLVQTTDREGRGPAHRHAAVCRCDHSRGGKGLIERISRDAKVPVIKHLDGNCHTYVDDPATSIWPCA